MRQAFEAHQREAIEMLFLPPFQLIQCRTDRTST